MSELVSIVIPVYNSAQFLKESLESIINQTYSNIEIICVNDGSTDDSLEILKSYSDKITIITQKNQGLASALNAGIKTMGGKWFKWFSPDDVMYTHTIETLVHAAKKYPDTVVYSNWEIIDEDGKKLRDFWESNYNELSNFEYNVRLLDGQQINVNTSLIPFSLFEKCSMRELDDPVAVDYDFLLHAALLCAIKFYLIPKPLIKYRIHTKQLSHKNISKTLEYISKIKNPILKQLDKSTQDKYARELKKYQKLKPKKRKTMEFGIKLLTLTPSYISDKILVFYLNKIRQSR
jgi:glycosyltransferase involved in cell wall biosynthesis|tara:strand:+ start:108 stop:980 length:873 start_codon:yes stop_codon:yes gene_type:complete